MINDETAEAAPTADELLQAARNAVRLWEAYRDAATPTEQADTNEMLAVAMVRLAGGLEAHGLAPEPARRVHLLWDCEDLISVHATAGSAERARVAHSDQVRAKLGDVWNPSVDEHIGISWRPLED